MTKEQLAEYFEYLDELLESGETNMFGARPYLARQFGLDLKDAGKILSAWMATDFKLPASARAEECGLLGKAMP
jgi:hypothetical protein